MQPSNRSSSTDENFEDIRDSLLPPKSRHIYEETYKTYRNWCSDKNIQETSEESILEYFNSNLSRYKSSSLWSKYSMLRSTISLREGIDIKNFPGVIPFLKLKGKGYTPKKSLALSKDHIDEFLIKADNKKHLLNKVVLIFGIAGACRRQELVSLLTTHIEDYNTHFLVKLEDTNFKTERFFIIVPSKLEKVNILELIREYMLLRPTKTPHKRFFVNYVNEKCTVQPVGINKIASVPALVAKYLDLENASSYTGHCFRRTSATLFSNTSTNLDGLRRRWGWCSSIIEDGYIGGCVKTKIDSIRRISSNMSGEDPSTCMSVENSTTPGALKRIKQENENTNKSNFEPDIYNQIYENFIDSARSNDSILSEEPYTIMKYEPLSPPPLLPLEIDYEEGNHPNDQRNENILLDQLSDKTMENVSFNRVNTTHRNKGAKSEEKGLFCNNRIPESNPEETDNFDFKNKIQEVRKIKNKWKYLRDYFNKETKNIEKTKPEITTAESPISSPYHSLLSFLKDILNTPLRDSTDMQVGRSHEIEEIDLDDEDKDTDDTASQFNDAFSPSSSVNKTPSRPSSRSSHTQNINKKHNQKRPLLTDDNEGIKKRRTQELPACAAQKQDDDDDLLFLKSLLPYMKSLPPSRKMRLRLKFQEFVLEQLEQNDSQNNLEEPFPRFIHTTSSTPSCSASDT